MNSKNKVNILFVCLGNICRSPSGEAVFQYYVNSKGYADKFYIDSAGTMAYHEGKRADARMSAVAEKRNYQLESIARKVIKEDIELFDLIVAMDQDNLEGLEAIANGTKRHIRLLGSFIEGYDNHNAPSVPDPYYGGLAGFEQVLDMIESACPNILSHCLELSGNK